MNECPVCEVSEISFIERIKEVSVIMLCSESFSVSPPELVSLDLDAIEERFSNDYKVTRKLRSIILEKQNGASITLMTKGNAVVNGVKTSEEAKAFYTKVLSTS
jgi:hypothetical protein